MWLSFQHSIKYTMIVGGKKATQDCGDFPKSKPQPLSTQIRKVLKKKLLSLYCFKRLNTFCELSALFCLPPPRKGASTFVPRTRGRPASLNLGKVPLYHRHFTCGSTVTRKQLIRMAFFFFFCMCSKVSFRERKEPGFHCSRTTCNNMLPVSTARPPLTPSFLGHRVEKSYTQ